ncbi:hypothetical protein BDR06DRAFT_1072085 [Suillus hirtellus]|nr:hypothetical protein BDR06DRAFT_1072085 [Suillus hirtellus]
MRASRAPLPFDEVERARVLHRPSEPIPQASQLHLLVHFGQHCPHLFRCKLHVDPKIFDDILNLISGHPIFHNNSNNLQLPISIQLAIFLNCVGHYGNSATLQDVSEWAGISVGSVVNCTNRIMVALLDQHDAFMGFPHLIHRTLSLLSNILHGKSKYSLGCQAVIMPHNLLIVDYSLGHPGSIHDAYAFRSTRIYQEHDTLLPAGHWVWADSAYPLDTWSVYEWSMHLLH